MNNAILKQTETSIKYYDYCDNELEYKFSVCVVIEGELEEGVLGFYAQPDESNNNLPLVCIGGGGNKTIIHEALHATIDFFRTTMSDAAKEMKFIFEPSTEGQRKSDELLEEAFVHYHGAFYDAIDQAVYDLT